MILDDQLSLDEGAVRPWKRQNESDGDGYYRQLLQAIPSDKRKIKMNYRMGDGGKREYETEFYGILAPNFRSMMPMFGFERSRVKVVGGRSMIACMTSRSAAMASRPNSSNLISRCLNRSQTES